MADVMIPPWLQPQPVAQMYAQGMNTGVAAAAQQNEAARAAAALQQQAAIQSAEMALRRDIAAQQAAQQGLSLQIEQQRNAALMALREKEMLDRAAYQAARLQDYDQGLQLRDQGLTLRELALTNQLNKPPPELYEKTLRDGRVVYQTPGGAIYDPFKKNEYDKVKLLDYQSAINRLNKISSSPILSSDTNAVSQAQSDVEKARAALGSLDDGNFIPDPQVVLQTSATRFMWDNKQGTLIPVQ